MAGAEPRTPPAELVDAVARLSPDLGREAVLEFLSGLDPEYWEREPPEDVAAHLRLIRVLSPRRPAHVRVVARDHGRYDVAIVAFDAFAEFAILCGLLAAHGLDVESGHVHTFATTASAPRARGKARSGAASRRIIDVFRVRPRRGPPVAAALERELVDLLSRPREEAAEAREQLSLRIVEAMEGLGTLPAAAEPLEVAFDNETSPEWTILDVRGSDVPGFLHAFANALATRGVYVHRVHIESQGAEAHDRFYVAARDGSKIEKDEDQQTLRLAVALTYHFTRLLSVAPDPGRALRSFDQLLDRVLAAGPDEPTLDLLRTPEGLRQLAQLLGSSAFLWEDFLRAQFEHLRPLLGQWSTRPVPDRAFLRRALRARLAGLGYEEARRRLNEFKDEEMLLVDMKRILDPAVTLEDFSRALTDLADTVLEEALRLANDRLRETHGDPRREDGSPSGFALFGLGKYGGAELGYASDVELLAVYAGSGRTTTSGLPNGQFFEQLVQELVGLIEARQDGIFHIDLRLRPHGGKGALASPLAALHGYYRNGGEAAPFERQALLKLRFVTGEESLGRAVAELRDRFVWSDEPWDRETSLHLRERQVRELVPPGRFNVKLSRGGLVDVEYSVQYLQIQHGRDHPALRTPKTLEALAALHDARFLSASDALALREAYLFWRRVADGLRMVRGDARDLLLPEEGSDGFRLLARRLGYRGEREERERALLADVRSHRERVASFFDRQFRESA